MKQPQSDPHFKAVTVDSADAIFILDNGPGDTTVRPVRPALREQLERLRQRLLSSPTDAPKPEDHPPSP